MNDSCLGMCYSGLAIMFFVLQYLVLSEGRPFFACGVPCMLDLAKICKTGKKRTEDTIIIEGNEWETVSYRFSPCGPIAAHVDQF